jgi:hypothetical protein
MARRCHARDAAKPSLVPVEAVFAQLAQQVQKTPALGRVEPAVGSSTIISFRLKDRFGGTPASSRWGEHCVRFR